MMSLRRYWHHWAEPCARNTENRLKRTRASGDSGRLDRLVRGRPLRPRHRLDALAAPTPWHGPTCDVGCNFYGLATTVHKPANGGCPTENDPGRGRKERRECRTAADLGRVASA